MNNKINRLHERALQIVYNDYKSSFKQLLTKDTSYSVHHLNIHMLVKLFNNMTNVYNNFFIRSSQTAINCLVSVRKFEFFQKNILHMHTTSLLLCYLTFSAKQMLFQPPMYQQNKVKVFVFIQLCLCIFTCIICIFVFIQIYLLIQSLFQIRYGCMFCGTFFGKKGHFACSESLNKCHFEPFLTKIFFSKLRGIDWVQQLHPLNIQNRPCNSRPRIKPPQIVIGFQEFAVLLVPFAVKIAVRIFLTLV